MSESNLMTDMFSAPVEKSPAELALEPSDLDGQQLVRLNPLPRVKPATCAWCREVEPTGLARGSAEPVCGSCVKARLSSTCQVAVEAEAPASGLQLSPEQEQEAATARATINEIAKRQGFRNANRLEGIGANSFDVDRAADLFDLTDIDELRCDNDYLVKGLIYKPGIAFVHAAPNVGKSFYALDLALTIASRMEKWSEKRVAQHPRVLYFFAESASRLWKRRDAWLSYQGVHAESLRGRVSIVPKPVDLTSDPGRIGALIEFIKREDYGLVIIDPWLMSIPGADANDAKEMMTALSNLIHVKNETGAAIVVVHHDNRSGNFLGSMAVDAMCDSRFHLSANGTDDLGRARVKIDLEKSRDDAKGTMNGRLESVPVGFDADGDQLSSAVFVHVEPDRPVMLTDLKSVINRMWVAIRETHAQADPDTPPPSVTDLSKDKGDLGIGGTPTKRTTAIEWLKDNGLVQVYTSTKTDNAGRERSYQALRPIIPNSSDSSYGPSSVSGFSDLRD